MTGSEALLVALKSTHYLLPLFINDLSDADLLVRPVPGANHIAWQLGHLITAEHKFAKEYLPGGNIPDLPAGFAGQHSKETAGAEPPKGFLSKAQYLEHFNAVRGAVIAAVEKLSPTDLDKPTTGPMAQFAPTVGHTMQLIANHTMMHAGQFSVVRRKLGKPIVF